jgi:hypothetical protein
MHTSDSRAQCVLMAGSCSVSRPPRRPEPESVRGCKRSGPAVHLPVDGR